MPLTWSQAPDLHVEPELGLRGLGVQGLGIRV